MILVRQLLISLLLLLQLLVPLLHAHSGADSFGKGIHVPGFEVFNTTANETVAKSCVIASWCVGDNGLIVAVDTGLKGNKDNVLAKLHKLLSDSCGVFYLQQTVVFKPALLIAVVYLIAVATLLSKPFAVAHLSRAPPL